MSDGHPTARDVSLPVIDHSRTRLHADRCTLLSMRAYGRVGGHTHAEVVCDATEHASERIVFLFGKGNSKLGLETVAIGVIGTHAYTSRTW